MNIGGDGGQCAKKLPLLHLSLALLHLSLALLPLFELRGSHLKLATQGFNP